MILAKSVEVQKHFFRLFTTMQDGSGLVWISCFVVELCVCSPKDHRVELDCDFLCFEQNFGSETR